MNRNAREKLAARGACTTLACALGLDDDDGATTAGGEFDEGEVAIYQSNPHPEKPCGCTECKAKKSCNCSH